MKIYKRTVHPLLILRIFCCCAVRAVIGQDTFLVGQNSNDTINLSQIVTDLYRRIGDKTGTGALSVRGLYNHPTSSSSGFLCAVLAVKGNEPFHTNDVADFFITVFHGGGYMNLGDNTNIDLQVGTNVFIEKGQTNQIVNLADDYTGLLACLFPNDNSGSTPEDTSSTRPDLDFTATPESTFKMANGQITNLLSSDTPAAGESHAVTVNARSNLMSVETVVLATTETYHVHENSALLVHVVKGNVETSSATDENRMIAVPEGSFMILDKCTPSKFVNLDGPDSPAILLKVHGPAHSLEDSPNVSDSPECLQARMPSQALLVTQDGVVTVDLTETVTNLYYEIGPWSFGSSALQLNGLYNNPDSFLCAAAAVKGFEPFHTNEYGDVFLTVIHGGGYLNLGNDKGLSLQVGTSVFVERGQPQQIFNLADDYTGFIACFFPNNSTGSVPEDSTSGQLPAFDQSPEATFKTTDGTVMNLLELGNPMKGEVGAIYSNAISNQMSVSTVVLATTETYHVREDSAMFVRVVRGNVETSSATDEDQMIRIPQGSFMILDKCTPHKFVNLDGPDRPAVLLVAFGPALDTPGHSTIFADSPKCLSTRGAVDTSQNDTQADDEFESSSPPSAEFTALTFFGMLVLLWY